MTQALEALSSGIVHIHSTPPPLSFQKPLAGLETCGFVGASRAARLSVWHGPSALGIASKRSPRHLGVSNLSGSFTWLTASDCCVLMVRNVEKPRHPSPPKKKRIILMIISYRLKIPFFLLPPPTAETTPSPFKAFCLSWSERAALTFQSNRNVSGAENESLRWNDTVSILTVVKFYTRSRSDNVCCSPSSRSVWVCVSLPPPPPLHTPAPSLSTVLHTMTR